MDAKVRRMAGRATIIGTNSRIHDLFGLIYTRMYVNCYVQKQNVKKGRHLCSSCINTVYSDVNK